jgi:hypothetical protein
LSEWWHSGGYLKLDMYLTHMEKLRKAYGIVLRETVSKEARRAGKIPLP